MKLSAFLDRVTEAYDSDEISEEIYDAVIKASEMFGDEDEECDYNRDDRLPSSYAEVEYTSEQLESDPLAIEGAKWDDMNYRHYMER